MKVKQIKIIFCIYIFYHSFSFVPFFLSFFFFRYSCVRNTDNVAISTIDICFQKMSKIVISFFEASPLSTCLVS